MFCGNGFNINVSGDVKEFTLNPAARCGIKAGSCFRAFFALQRHALS
jgi:hypothetical protein